MDIHIPFTGVSPKDRELDALRAELARANQTIGDLRIARDIANRKADEFKQHRDQYREGYESAAKRVDQLTKEVNELKWHATESTREQNAARQVVQLLENGFDPKNLPGQDRAFELARKAEDIREEAAAGCGQYYELYEARLC